MKIRKLRIHDIDYKPLMKNLDFFFPKSEDEFIHANCLIGNNGSGKSQILELVAEIFLFLDTLFRTQNRKEKETSPFGFRIEYEMFIDNIKHLIIVDCEKIDTKKKDIFVDVLADNDDEYEFLDDQRLITAQRGYKKNREYSLLFAVGFYVLNIVDANIDAHLKQFNVSDDLTLQPDLIQQDMHSKPTVGLTLNYKF